MDTTANTFHNLAQWQRDDAAARIDDSAFWLAQTAHYVCWEKAPTIGREGDFESVREQPIRWFSDGLQITNQLVAIGCQPEAASIEL